MNLQIAQELGMGKLRQACVRAGMQSLHCLEPIVGSNKTDNPALGQLDHKVRAQLRAISGLQQASRKMGLGAAAFDDGARCDELLKQLCERCDC